MPGGSNGQQEHGLVGLSYQRSEEIINFSRLKRDHLIVLALRPYSSMLFRDCRLWCAMLSFDLSSVCRLDDVSGCLE